MRATERLRAAVGSGTRFRRRALFALAVLVALLVAATQVGMELALRREIQTGLAAELRATGDALGEEMRGRMEQLAAEARVVAESPMLKAALTTPGVDRRTLEDVAEDLRAAVRWNALGLVDGESSFRALVGAPAAPLPVGLHDALWGKQASAFWVNGEHLYAAAAVPLAYGDRVVGALVAAVDLSSMRVGGPNAAVALFAGSRLVSASFPAGSAERADLARLGPPANVRTVRLGPENFLARDVRLDSTGVHALVLRSQDLAFAPYCKRRAAHAGIGVVALVLASAVSFYLARALWRPVAALERHAQRTQATLDRSEARFSDLIENLPDGIAVHRDGRILYVNPSFVALLGYGGAADVVGRPALDLVHGDDRAQAARRHDALRQTGQPQAACDVRLVRRDATPIVAEVVALVADYGGEAAILEVARDVTERKQMQARLLLADRMTSVGTLAAGVAHEINNPLAYVIANLSFVADAMGAAARDGTAHLGEAREALDEARQGADRVRTIVRDLKAFSRADETASGPVDVRRVLRSSMQMAKNEIRHRARLIEDLGDVPAVLANESRLGQVFLNLLINAAQAVPEGDVERNEIRVATRHAGGRVVVEVRDTGPGIPPEVLGRLFDPFFTTKPVGVGTGLGLTICHGIVTALGGEIAVQSEPGRGALFRVSLPAVEAEEQEAAHVEAPDAAPARRGRVLVVDDEPLIGKVVRRMLGREHEVVALTRPREALSRLASGERFDLILCDMMMPEMTGMDVFDALGGLAPEQLGRMVFLTGGAFTPRARDFLERIPNPHIEKPFDEASLRAHLIERLGAI
jgi:PAS domain S-box-containing protein